MHVYIIIFNSDFVNLDQCILCYNINELSLTLGTQTAFVCGGGVETVTTLTLFYIYTHTHNTCPVKAGSGGLPDASWCSECLGVMNRLTPNCTTLKCTSLSLFNDYTRL